ncbi:MAG: ABC transporter ATP-binding protein [Betaproteobacteria bacterium]|nr:ABC transporter ATP-binding protein [Betaproteobacteria bacterium]
MPQEVIRADRVSKKFCRVPRRALLYTGTDVARSFFGLRQPSDTLRSGEFWAVRDVSFSLARGESLAIIGSNGSGKSTLLNLLNGVLAPDTGAIDARGRVGALAAIGAGFNPLLTGRENITINGLMLGMSLREVRELSDAIIEFSEVGEFIDVPVHQYSSGMYVRLGFAIAVHAPVEIVLIDEVLAVGDLAFSVKCLRKIVELRDSGRAVVLITHAMHNVKFVCNHALWIEKGVVHRYGEAAAVATEYEQYMLAKADGPTELLHYDDRVVLRSFRYPRRIEAGQPLTIDAELELSAPVERPLFCLHMHTSAGETLVFSHYSTDRGASPTQIEGRQHVRMTTGPLSLHPGNYDLSFSLSERELANYLFWHNRSYPLEVVGDAGGYGLFDAGVEFEMSATPITDPASQT